MDGLSAGASGAAETGANQGQGLVEYALILVLISILSIGIVTTIGGQVSGLYTAVSAAL